MRELAGCLERMAAPCLVTQPCFADLGYSRGDFPVSEELASSVLALPVHSDLSELQIEYVVEQIRSFYR